MDRRREIQKKSPPGSSGRTSEFGINVPCFPSPMFSSHSHMRHVLPQIPTRAGHPRMAVSKASTKDPFLGRVSEGELFADVITTHQLDDSLEETPHHIVAKDFHDDWKFRDRTRPEIHKSATGGGEKDVSAQQSFADLPSHLSHGDVKGWRPLPWEEDVDHMSAGLTFSSSPSRMLNTGESTATKKRRAMNKSPGSTTEFAKESKEFLTVTASSDSGFVTTNSKLTKQSGRLDFVQQQQQKYSKPRDLGKSSSSLFPMFDEDDSDDDHGSADTPVAINLSLATKSAFRSSPGTESSPRFPAPQHQASSCGISASSVEGSSPLNAILKMTNMINTSKNQPPPPPPPPFFAASTDMVDRSFRQKFSPTFTPVQLSPPRDAWPRDARIFGSSGSPGISYGKIAADGMLKPTTTVLLDSDSAQAQNTSSQMFSVSSMPASSESQAVDSSLESSKQFETSLDKSEEDHKGPAPSPITHSCNPIKLRIRRSADGDASSELSIVTSSKQMKDVPKVDDVAMKPSPGGDAPPKRLHPSPLALSLLGATPSASGSVPSVAAKLSVAAPIRAKTKGELKKQLIERKEQRLQRTDGSQASSPAGSTTTASPACSHADTLSPLSVSIDGGSVTPQPSPQLNAGKTSAVSVAVTSPAAEKTCDASATKWKLGDMLWAKVSGHPWWPCIVLPDPELCVCSKPVQRRQNVVQLQYHVHYYGEANERGWVSDTSVIRFRGRAAFDVYVERMVVEHRRDRKSFSVSTSRKRAWEIAVSEAEMALGLSRRQRIEIWMPSKDLQIPDDRDSGSEQDQNEDAKPAGRCRPSPRGKKAKAASDRAEPGLEVLPKSDHIQLPKSISNRQNAQFAVFCQKRRISLRSENPGITDEDVDSLLVDEWRRLDTKTRARYIPMGSDVIHLSDVSVVVSPTGKTDDAQKAAKKSPKVGPHAQHKKPNAAHMKEDECERSERRRTRSSELISEDGKQPQRTTGELMSEDDSPLSRRETRSRTLSTDTPTNDAGSKLEEKEQVNQRHVIRDPRTTKPSEKKSLGAVKTSAVAAKSSVVETSTAKRQAVKTSTTKAKDVKTSKSTENIATRLHRESKELAQTEEEKVRVTFPPKKRRRESITDEDKTTTPAEPEKAKPPATDTDSADSDSSDHTDSGSESDDDVTTDTCPVCDKPVTSDADTVRCTSRCNGAFHRACLKQSHAAADDKSFECTDCKARKQKCFVCKVDNSDSHTIICSEKSCSQLYHVSCVKTLLPDDELSSEQTFTCPLHCCATCQALGKTTFPDGECNVYFQCVQCPSAYHADGGQKCVAAGSQSVAGLCIVCPRHFEPVKSNTHHSRVHTSWCCICQLGDELVACERCPVSYHINCLPTSSAAAAAAAGPQLCPDCRQGRPCLYGDMVWVKFGSYRWWPGKICFPEDIPDNILERPHYVGEFVVRFYGSHDYLWTHRGRVFPFSDKDKCCHDFTSSSKGVPKDFVTAIDEAIASFKKKKPSDRDATRCKLPPAYAAGTLSSPSDETPATFEFKPFWPEATEDPVDWIAESVASATDAAAADLSEGEDAAECFACGRPGRLVLCDRIKCGRSYHLSCAGVRRLPHGVWSCSSHHCDDCARSATVSCAFCPTAFCSEHHHGKMRLSEYYQLICVKHDDVVLCEDPSVLKIFGLCKSPPKSSSSCKPLRRKSGGGIKKVKGEADDRDHGNADGTMSANRMLKQKRKFDTSILEARERSPPKRSCRDRDVKAKEHPDQALSLDRILAKLGGGKNVSDDAKRPKPMKTEQRAYDKRRGSFETGEKRRHHSSEKDSRAVKYSSPLSSEGMKKSKKFAKTSGGDRIHVDLEDLRKDKKSSMAFARDQRQDHSQLVKHEQDMQKQHRVIDLRESTGESAVAARSNFSSSLTAASSLSLSSGLLSADSLGAGHVDKTSSVGKSTVVPAKSLVDEEPLFDNSDDEFPELVIDVP